jgi:protein-S-isoprenylcysteine O-methyltransferase Ste14
MVFDTVRHIIFLLWLVTAAVWFLAALRAKPAVRTQSATSRALYGTLAVAAYFVGFSRLFTFGVLARPFAPASSKVAYFGLALVFVGIVFAIWARFFLGSNWSGRVSVKQDHTLVRRGPYALVRHPIYSGLLLAVLGTAIAYREIRGLIAAGMVLWLLLSKIGIEEAFMSEHFGSQYTDYQRQVKALIPFVY